jgi:hypothetical protein
VKLSGRLAVDLVESGIIRGTKVEGILVDAMREHCEARDLSEPPWLMAAERRVLQDRVRRLEEDGSETTAPLQAAAERQLAHLAGESIVSRAIEEHRLEPGQRDVFLRMYELDPDLVAEQIAHLPYRPELDERAIAATLGIPAEEVI